MGTRGSRTTRVSLCVSGTKRSPSANGESDTGKITDITSPSPRHKVMLEEFEA